MVQGQAPATGKFRKGVKPCPKCSGEMGLFWKDRKRSETAFAPERTHVLMCPACGFSRSERFVDFESYPILLSYADNGRLVVSRNEGNDPGRPVDNAATIARFE